MSNREQQLLIARPLIPTIIEAHATSAAEQFQNKTLRPILKMQNDLLVKIFRHYIIQRKNVFPTLPRQQQLAYIENSIRKDLKFRNLLIGCVMGQFTLEELERYHQNSNELRKRLVNMLVERLKGELVED